MNACAPVFESGMVWRPDMNFAEEVVEECASFPNGEHDDLADSMTQAILRFNRVDLSLLPLIMMKTITVNLIGNGVLLMANGKYDSPEDRKRRTTTRTLSALQEQEVKYKDASASPAETRQRGKELFASKMGLPREGKSRSIDDIAGAKLKSERKRDLDRLKEIEKMQKKKKRIALKKLVAVVAGHKLLNEAWG